MQHPYVHIRQDSSPPPGPLPVLPASPPSIVSTSSVNFPANMSITGFGGLPLVHSDLSVASKSVVLGKSAEVSHGSFVLEPAHPTPVTLTVELMSKPQTIKINLTLS